MAPPKIQAFWTYCIHYTYNYFGLSIKKYKFFGLNTKNKKTNAKPLQTKYNLIVLLFCELLFVIW